MKVKIFDESHETDLEKAINDFLEEKELEIIDVKFGVSASVFGEEQIYCFSALILYKNV
ncbi:MAG: sporulation protein Cse60 [Bacilli bacterium]|nr:sporulation protein Cse60 [Bacilli bacterium]